MVQIPPGCHLQKSSIAMKNQPTISPKALQAFLGAAHINGITEKEAREYLHKRERRALRELSPLSFLYPHLYPQSIEDMIEMAEETTRLLANEVDYEKKEKERRLDDLYRIHVGGGSRDYTDNEETDEIEADLFEDHPDLPEKFKNYVDISHSVIFDGRIDWQGSMNDLAFVARHLWYDNEQFRFRSVFDKACRYFVFREEEIDEKAFSRAFHKDEVKSKNPGSFGFSP